MEAYLIDVTDVVKDVPEGVITGVLTDVRTGSGAKVQTGSTTPLTTHIFLVFVPQSNFPASGTNI